MSMLYEFLTFSGKGKGDRQGKTVDIGELNHLAQMRKGKKKQIRG